MHCPFGLCWVSLGRLWLTLRHFGLLPFGSLGVPVNWFGVPVAALGIQLNFLLNEPGATPVADYICFVCDIFHVLRMRMVTGSS